MLDLVTRQIHQNGPLDLPAYLQLALYHPQLGYYPRATVGRHGDFFTSVSVGPLFGRLLAGRFHRWWLANGRPSPWRITEVGAHDGSLAIDVLTGIQQLDPHALAAVRYAIPEPLPSLAAIQQEKLTAKFPGVAEPAATLDELAARPLPGVLFANELIDALPFHLVRRHHGQWLERFVTVDANGALAWHDAPTATPAVAGFLATLGDSFPDGYTTEVRLATRTLLAKFTATLGHGLVCLIDYGFPQRDYYHPARTHGTLRTFSRHHAGDNPLDQPGQQDITAHVDFSALARDAQAAGLHPHLWADQGRYLTHLAHDWLASLEHQSPAIRQPLLRQFQTLTHPAHLGSRFHVLELLHHPTQPGFSIPHLSEPLSALEL